MSPQHEHPALTPAEVRTLLAALAAARHGMEPAPDLTARVTAGGGDVRLGDLRLDSLGVMEFCIAIELETGAELTPDLLAGFDTLADVADWLRDHHAPALR